MFLVIDSAWRVFSQTGNIEAYLLLKELENDSNQNDLNEDEIDATLIHTNESNL